MVLGSSGSRGTASVVKGVRIRVEQPPRRHGKGQQQTHSSINHTHAVITIPDQGLIPLSRSLLSNTVPYTSLHAALLLVTNIYLYATSISEKDKDIRKERDTVL